MELSFATKKLRAEALDRSKAEQVYGQGIAIELHARLADLAAAVTVSDLPGVTGWETDDASLRVRVSSTGVLVCAPVPAPSTLPVDWSRTHRLKVLGIEEGV